MSVALSAGTVAGHAATRAHVHPDQVPFTLASGTVNDNGLDTDTSFCYEPAPLPTAITNDPVSPTCTPPPADPSAVNPFDIATPYAGWAAPLAGSTWVGPQANGQDNQEQVPGWYIYDADFNGCAEFSGNVRADNDVGVFINGQLISDKVNAFGSSPLSFTGLTTNTGLNIIDFVVYDASSPATGLDYSISVTPTNCSEFPVPAVGLVKSASIASYSSSGAGTTITYTYTVTNTGDVTLAPLTVTDPMTGLSAINCDHTGSNVIPSLAPGASETCTATYTITGTNVKTGSITNVGTVTGETSTGDLVKYNSSLTIPEKGKPFTCNTPTSFLSQSISGPATQLGASHYLFNAALFNAVGPAYAHNYNALGFDTTNDYLYAMRSIGATNTLIRIDAAGGVTVPGGASGLGAMYVGAFDGSGNYWVTRGGTSTAAYEINLGTGAASPPVTMSRKFLPYDWSLDGTAGGQSYLWGLSGSTLYRAELPAGTVTPFALPTTIPVAPGTYGAAWTFSNGDLGFDNNATGQIDRVTVTAPTGAASAHVVAQYYGTGTGFKSNVNVNDGAACSAPGTDLSIVKTGPATVAPDGTITWTMTVTNNGPGNSSGFVVDDAAPAGITNFTTSTPGCSIVGKPATVQCAEGELDNGDTFTITVTGTAPQKAGACVTNTATVSANETDPNPKNNTSSVKTCTTTSDDIYTVAGDGTQGYSGDGGPATAAELSAPQGIALDASGNELIADSSNYLIRVVAASTGTFYGQAMTAGDIYTVAGNGTSGYSGDGGPATSAELGDPTGVSTDSSGNLLIADSENNAIRVVAESDGTFYGQAMTAGDIYTVVGSGAGLREPQDVSTDSSGNLLITDTENNRIRVLAATTGTFYGQAMTPGNIYTVAGDGTFGYSGDGGPATSAELSFPHGVSTDSSGNLLIADTYNAVIRVVADTTGTFYGQAMTAGDIYTVAGNGTSGYSGNGGPATSAELSFPKGVSTDSSGNLLIADSGNAVIRVLAESAGTFYGQAMTAGDIYTVAGNGTSGYSGDGGPATSAELSDPQGVISAGSGNLLIADTGNSVIREVTG